MKLGKGISQFPFLSTTQYSETPSVDDFLWQFIWFILFSSLFICTALVFSRKCQSIVQHKQFLLSIISIYICLLTLFFFCFAIIFRFRFHFIIIPILRRRGIGGVFYKYTRHKATDWLRQIRSSRFVCVVCRLNDILFSFTSC